MVVWLLLVDISRSGRLVGRSRYKQCQQLKKAVKHALIGRRHQSYTRYNSACTASQVQTLNFQNPSIAVPYDSALRPPSVLNDRMSSPVPDRTGSAHRIVIQGVTKKGRAFRPSDWAERLCGIMCTFGGDQQMRYSPYVRPVMLDGVRCVIVEPSLIEVEPRAYRFLLDFASDNELVVIDPSVTGSDDFCPVPGSALEKLVSP